MSWTPRVDGARRRSRVNWRAMPPVAGVVRTEGEVEVEGGGTEDAPAEGEGFGSHDGGWELKILRYRCCAFLYFAMAELRHIPQWRCLMKYPAVGLAG
jgi:hypothetical protein